MAVARHFRFSNFPFLSNPATVAEVSLFCALEPQRPRDAMQAAEIYSTKVVKLFSWEGVFN